MQTPDLPLGYYRHFKGAFYRVAGFARDCDSQQWHVYYQCCYGDWSYWLRPLDNFIEQVERGAEVVARFTYVGLERPEEIGNDCAG